MILTKVISTLIESGLRKIKFFRFGKDDVNEVRESMPFGIDSNPLKDMIAIYSDTATKGKGVIIGYINKHQIADVGELRLYSADNSGVKFFIHLKKDGTCEFNGNTDFLVKHTKLNLDLQQTINQLNLQLTAIATGITGVGGIYVPTPVTLDISDAKTDKIKV